MSDTTAAVRIQLVGAADTDTAPMRAVLTAEDGTTMKQAANVATTGSVADVINALVAAGLMAAPDES